VDLVLSDIVMPRMMGTELAERITARWPKTKVLFMSGYAESPLVRSNVRRDGSNFIGKPFSPEALLQKVRGLMRGEGLRVLVVD